MIMFLGMKYVACGLKEFKVSWFKFFMHSVDLGSKVNHKVWL